MLNRWRLGITTALLLLVSASTLAQSAPVKRTDMLVSTQWLADHLNDPGLVILQTAEKPDDYNKAHIPGARYVAFADFIADDPTRAELPPPEQLKQTFEKLGISDDTRVVIYTSDWYPYAARLWFTLDYLGHGSHAALLDGGITQWTSEKRTVTADVPPAAKPGSLSINIHPEYRAMLEEVKAASESSGRNGIIIDARPAKRYEAGHISGATNLYWKDTVAGEDHPTLLPADKLRSTLTAAGLKPEGKVITYCEVGIQASHDYFVAKYLGYNAAMYDGSYHEWSMMKGLPTVKGTSAQK